MAIGYLDAGSASIAVSVVAAGIAGAGVAARSVLGKFKRSKNDGEMEATEEASARNTRAEG